MFYALKPLRLTVAATIAAASLACGTAAQAGFTLFEVGGDASTASVQGTVDAFRAALGAPNNGNSPGTLAGGRREINWDGSGSTVASSAGALFTGFQNSRGGTFTTPGTGFIQTPVAAAALTDIQPSYATTFGAFSPVRVFTPLGSNVTEATFSIPGSGGATPATVAGFGALFSDVDLASTTSLEFFDLADNLLYTAYAPRGTVADGSLSFVGALANGGEQIARVRITTGNQALGLADSNGNPVDVVVMDDFLYSEPQSIPEPAGLALAAGGLAIGWLARRRS